MKARKLLFTFFLIITLSFVLVSCGGGDDSGSGDKEPPVEEFKPVAITTILDSYTNNQAVQAEGVVYGVTENGFYLADSAQGHIFVVMTSSWKKDVAVGDKVQVTGEFGYSKNLLQIKSVSKYEKVSSGNAVPTSVEETTVKAIEAYSNESRAVYGKVVRFVGNLAKDAINMYSVTDEEGNKVYFDNNSNVAELAKFDGKRISINAVVYKYLVSDNAWSLSFVGGANDIAEAPLTFEDIKARALEHITSVVPQAIYGAIELPVKHSVISNIAYSWAVEENEYISIVDNKATIVTSDVDHEVTLKVTISSGENAETVDYKIVLKAIVEQSVSEFYANIPAFDDSVVIVRGIIVSFARNQSLSTRSVILMDPTTKQTVPVDFGKSEGYITNDSEEFAALQLGDEIVVKAQYSISGRPTIQKVYTMEKRSSGNSYTHDYENAYVLNDNASYSYLAEHVYEFSGKLVKFTNPFMNYSTSSTPAANNWVRLGYDAASGNSGYATQNSNRCFAFLIAAINENLGSELWHKGYDIPLLNAPAKSFNIDIYAYCLYVSDSYVAFIIPDTDAYVVPANEKVKMEIESTIPTSVEEGSIELMSAHELVEGAITWTSSHPEVIDPTTGVVAVVKENTVVTLTATYVVEGVAQELVMEVTVLKSTPLTVSALLATGVDGTKYKVEGVVVGFTSDGNDVESRKGVIIMDTVSGKMVFVDGIGTLYNTESPNYVDVNGVKLEIGMSVVVTGLYGVNTAQIGSGPAQIGRKHIDVSSEGKVVAGEKTNFEFNDVNAVVIDSHEKAGEVVADLENIPFGQLIKFVGTSENPIYFGGSASTAPMNMKVFMSNATDNNGTKYNGKTYVFKDTTSNEVNGGENWFQDRLALPKAFVAPNKTNASRAVIGTVYAVITHLTGSYYQMAVVNIDNWNTQPEVKYVKENIAELVASSVESGQSIELPASTFLAGAITWTSSSELFDASTGVAGTVEENTDVTLTGTFTYCGETVSVDVVVTIIAPLPATPLTVTELVALAEDTAFIRVQGVVVGFSSDGNSNESRKGLIVMDNATGKMVLLNNIEGATYPEYNDKNGTLIKVGDEIIVEGDYFVSTDAIDSKAPYQTNRHNVAVSQMEIVQSGVTINYHEESAIVIDSNEDAVAMFESLDKVPYGQLIKVVGTEANPFYLGGSSSKNPFNIKLFFNDAADNNGTKYNGKTLTLKSDVNAAIGGSATWFTDLFGIEGPFVGPSSTVPAKAYSGTLYLVITHTTGSYYQANLVNYANCSATSLAQE